MVKTNRNLLAPTLVSERLINAEAGSREQQYRTYRACKPSAEAITVEPLRPARRGSADQSGFADRGIRIVTLALGGGLGDDLGCIAITHPMSRFLHPMTQLRQGPETDPHALLQYVCLFR